MDLLAFDAYFFDFDGLLADTEPVHYEAYQILLKRRNLQLPWDFTTYCHFAHQRTEVFAEAMFSLFPALKEEQPDWMILREEKQEIYQGLITSQPIHLMRGAPELITYLAKRPMYVVTNASKNQVEAIISLQPILKKIPTWITREDYKRPKPAPDGYLKALEHYGNPQCKGVGFEDATRGIAALKAAHIHPVLILPSNYPKPDPALLEGVSLFHSLEELIS